MGRTLERPHDCPENVYDVMKDCWRLRPAERPSWKVLVNALQGLYIGEEEEEEGFFKGAPLSEMSS